MTVFNVIKGQFQYPGVFLSEPGLMFDLSSTNPPFAELVTNQTNSQDNDWFAVDVLEVPKMRVNTDEGETLIIPAPNKSPRLVRRIYVGTFYTKEQVAAAQGADSILYGNIDYPMYVGAVFTRMRNWQPVRPEDVVLDTYGQVRYSK